MKKRIAAVAAAGAALVLTLGVLAGCSGNDQAQQSASSSADASDTKLVVGFDNSYPPYGFIGDDGEYTGFDLDLAAEVASRNG